MGKYHPKFLPALILAAVAASCTTGTIDSRHPSLNSIQVIQSSNNMMIVLTALKMDIQTVAPGKMTWYDVSEAGFNYIDAQCNDYFTELFFVDRKRSAVRGAISGFAHTTNAILGLANASTLSMAVVTQGFGLADRLTEIVANTFLYQLPPAHTLVFVKELRTAYRVGAARRQAEIRTPASAYHELQNYLELCLPPMIEAQLIKHIAGAKALAVADGGQTRIVVGSDQGAERRAIQNSVRTLTSATQQKLPKVAEPASTPGAINPYEARMPKARLIAIQNLLCLEGPAANGTWTQETRNALMKFYEAGGYPRPEIVRRGVEAGDITPKIDEALLRFKGELTKSCTGTGQMRRAFTSAEILGTLMF